MRREIKSAVRFLVPTGIMLRRRNKRLDKYAFYETSMELPSRKLEDLFPGIGSIYFEISISELYRPPNMVMPIVELLTLSAICRHTQPNKIFEIGTFTGSTTLAMAKSSSPETEIYTLDLPPDDDQTCDSDFMVGSVFKNTAESSKIHQLFGDSATFDFVPYFQQMDLVLVDANHSYNSVKRDTETAFRLVRPGGIVIWDDYALDIRHPECAGVTRAVNEISIKYECFQIQDTRLAFHKSQVR